MTKKKITESLYPLVEVKAELKKRTHLSEGRTYGLGFAMTKKVKDKFETVHYPSTCKDYLNDIVLVEAFDITAPVGVFGLSYTRQGIFNEDGSGYLFIHPLADKYGNEAEGFSLAREIENLHKNIGIIENTITEIERLLKFTQSTKIMRASNNDGYLFHLAKEWCANPYMISMVSLIIRVAQYFPRNLSYTGIIMAGTNLDASYVVTLKQKIQYMMATGISVLPYTVMEHWKSQPGNCHNYGQNMFNMKTDSNAKALKDPIKGVYATDGSIYFDDKATKKMASVTV